MTQQQNDFDPLPKLLGGVAGFVIHFHVVGSSDKPEHERLQDRNLRFGRYPWNVEALREKAEALYGLENVIDVAEFNNRCDAAYKLFDVADYSLLRGHIAVVRRCVHGFPRSGDFVDYRPIDLADLGGMAGAW